MMYLKLTHTINKKNKSIKLNNHNKDGNIQYTYTTTIHNKQTQEIRYLNWFCENEGFFSEGTAKFSLFHF